eukprot:1176274-Prorocentrum_minimum.AAC.2
MADAGADERTQFVAGIQRDINCLTDNDRSTRKRGLTKLSQRCVCVCIRSSRMNDVNRRVSPESKLTFGVGFGNNFQQALRGCHKPVARSPAGRLHPQHTTSARKAPGKLTIVAPS